MSETDYQAVFRGAPVAQLLLQVDERFTIVDASDVYLRVSQTTRDIVGRGLFEVFQVETANRAATMTNLRGSLERVIASGAADTMSVQRYELDRDGGGVEDRYWSAANTPVLSATGVVEHIVHRVEDVTELMQARAAEQSERQALVETRTHLRELETELRATQILESMIEGFFLIDREWRFVYVNGEAQRILDATASQLLGQTLWAAYPGLEGTEFERSYRRAMGSREPTSFVAYYPQHARWYDVTAYPTEHGIAVYFRDVTDEKIASLERERLVAESERQSRMYEAALSNTPDLVYIFDLEHRFIYANEALLEMWGTTREEALGKRCLELGYEPWHAAMHEREIDQVAATGAAIRGEVPFHGTNGRRMYDYIFVPVKGADDRVVAVAGTTRDITDRQLVEQAIREQAERLREIDRAKDEFLATLSHELRNPLAPLRSALTLLKDPGPDLATAPIHAMMERQVEHLVRLVDDLLEMSRISRGTLVLRRERVDLAEVVKHAVETSAPLIEQAGHALEVVLPDEPLRVDGDPVRLAQILGNLLNNSAKYTEPGGYIRIEASATADSVDVMVRDDGAGIAPELLPRMFDMFSRGDRVSGRGQGGLGIGLALARRLAQLHEGRLEAKSDGPGKGSELTLRLPRLADAAPVEVAPQRVDALPARQRILIVDDNVDAAEMLGMLLSRSGAEVRVVYGGADAIATFETYEPDVVLLDLGMPEVDGYEVARTLRARHPDRSFTIVALSGWGQEEDRRRAREAGFDHHLVKPVDAGTLRAYLGSLAT